LRAIVKLLSDSVLIQISRVSSSREIESCAS